MKKILLLLMAVLSTQFTKAETDHISAQPVTVEAGQPATITIDLVNEVKDYVAFTMDIALPEGLSFGFTEKRGKVEWTEGLSADRVDDHTLTSEFPSADNKQVRRYLASSMKNNTFYNEDEEGNPATALLNVGILVDEALAPGDYIIKVTNVNFNSLIEGSINTEDNIFEDIEITVTVTNEAAEEADRVAANEAAALADMELVEALQAEMSAAIAGNEEFISEEDNKLIEEFLGEKYAMDIQEAYAAVETEGVYASPINEEDMRAVIEGIKANIEAAKKAAEEAEEARVAANDAAFAADVEALKKLQDEDFGTVAISDYFEYVDEEAVEALGEKLSELFEQAWAAYEAVETEGVYESIVDYDALKAEIDAIAAAAQAAKKAAEEAAEAEAARVAANEAAAMADMELLEALQAEMSAAIAGNEEFISEEDNKLIEEFLGEKYAMDIQEAYAAVETEGVYASPINEEDMRAVIEGIKANIEAAKKAAEEVDEEEAARRAANLAAAQADVLKLEALQAEISDIIKGNEEYISTETKDLIEILLGDSFVTYIAEAYVAVEEAGTYVTPIDYAQWNQWIEEFKAEIQTNIGIATSINVVAAKNNATTYNMAGQKVGANYKGMVIVNGKKVIRK